MPAYVTQNATGTQQAIASTTLYKTQVLLWAWTGVALTRAAVHDINVGTAGTPADGYVEYDVSRCDQSTTGSSGALTPAKLDLATRAGGTQINVNYSSEPATYTSSLFYLGLIQRASYRWMAAPGSEIIVPAVNFLSVGLRARGTATTTIATTIMYTE